MTLLSNEINTLAAELLKLCQSKNIMIATAESCTGGLITAALTEISGSSAVVDRGFITYSNEAKHEMLGVSKSKLDAFGAVSEQVAIEMANGALQHSNAQLAIAVTGTAGPNGGTIDKPVGLVHIAVKFGKTTVHKKHLYGALSRAEIRNQTVRSALSMCIELFENSQQAATLN